MTEPSHSDPSATAESSQPMSELPSQTVKPVEPIPSTRTAAGASSISIQAAPSEAVPEEPDYQDCDSDALEALEDEAEEESEDEAEYGRLVDEAAEVYPPERIEGMLEELKSIGLLGWLRKYVNDETPLLTLLVALGVLLPRGLRSENAPRPFLFSVLKTALHRFLQRREKLSGFNTLEDVLSLLSSSHNTLVLSGAGLSVSCGIPDFRSKDGIYSRLQQDPRYVLQDPQDMFDISTFLYTPEIFYSFAREIYPSNFKPSPGHRFIRLLEQQGRLLRNYTQNIDTLEVAAGLSPEKVLNCHGSFATAKCITCDYTCPGTDIKADIFAQRVPDCPACEEKRRHSKSIKKSKKRKKRAQSTTTTSSSSEGSENDSGQRSGILKPCITFFGESLASSFSTCLLSDRSRAQLLLVIGTSLKVAPVSSVVGHLPHSVPVVLINRTPILHVAVDVMLLGDADVIVQWLCEKLGWQLPPRGINVLDIDGQGMSRLKNGLESRTSPTEKEKGPSEPQQRQEEEEEGIYPTRLGESHIWLFPGAEPGPLLDPDPGSESEPESESESGDDDEVEGEGEEGRKGRDGQRT